MKPREFWVDKQSVNIIDKNPTQCHWVLLAKNPEDKTGNYLFLAREVVPIDWARVWQRYNIIKVQPNTGPRDIIRKLVEEQLRGEDA